LGELVEAAHYSHQNDRGIDALRRLTRTTDAAGTDWGLGLQASLTALTREGDTADRLHQEGIARLGRTRIRLALARAHLRYGEWLRRENRRLDARNHLRTAHQMLSGMGVEGFAERARRELSATGETARRAPSSTPQTLTAQEEQIARLVSSGRTNPEIGSELFISARTVEWHLRKIFTKLDITSRKQLRNGWPSRADSVSA
jgi:DNA-binding CsgD family transcriptional regulator